MPWPKGFKYKARGGKLSIAQPVVIVKPPSGKYLPKKAKSKQKPPSRKEVRKIAKAVLDVPTEFKYQYRGIFNLSGEKSDQQNIFSAQPYGMVNEITPVIPLFVGGNNQD